LSIISLTCDILRSNFSTQPAYIVQISLLRTMITRWL